MERGLHKVNAEWNRQFRVDSKIESNGSDGMEIARLKCLLLDLIMWRFQIMLQS